MGMKPKISIITITFNSEKTIEDTIKSVVSQNYENLEYIIVDGKSTDQTLKIVDKYKDKISRVISEPDRGISDAFNKGIRNATGEIVGIINSDDQLLPGALDTIAASYNPSVDVYRGRMVIWNEQTGAKFSETPTLEFPIARKIKSVCHPSTFVAKRAYDKWGCFQIKYRYMMDVDLLHRLYRNSAVIKYIDNDLALFKLGGATSSNWRKKLREAYWVVMDNGGGRFRACCRCISFALYQIVKDVLFKMAGEDNVRSHKYKIISDSMSLLFSLFTCNKGCRRL